MPTSDPSPVRTGVIATVVGGTAMAILGELWPPAKQFVMWLWDGIKSFASLFGDTYKTPGWLLLTFGILALITVVRFFVSLVPKFAPAYTKYVEQELYGALWQWNWSGGDISNLWCLCPNCKGELVYDDSSAHSIYRREEPHTDFNCEKCNGRLVARFPGGGKDYALSAVKREIRRRIRTGESGSEPGE